MQLASNQVGQLEAVWSDFSGHGRASSREHAKRAACLCHILPWLPGIWEQATALMLIHKGCCMLCAMHCARLPPSTHQAPTEQRTRTCVCFVILPKAFVQRALQALPAGGVAHLAILAAAAAVGKVAEEEGLGVLGSVVLLKICSTGWRDSGTADGLNSCLVGWCCACHAALLG